MKCKDSKTPLIVASLYGHKKIVKILLHAANIDANAKDNVSLFPMTL